MIIVQVTLSDGSIEDFTSRDYPMLRQCHTTTQIFGYVIGYLDKTLVDTGLDFDKIEVIAR